MSLTLELLILRLVCLFSGADKAIVNFKGDGIYDVVHWKEIVS